jgi:hypothetical protein
MARSGLRFLSLAACFALAYGSTGVFAQKADTDTAGIIEKIVEKIDTVVRTAIPDTTLEKWSNKPIDSVFFKNNSTRIKKELYNLIIKSTPEKQKIPTTNTGLAAMDGKIIRNIEFRHIDMFSPDVTDTIYKAGTWIERTVNAWHKDTKENLLKRYLIIHPGDMLDVFQAAENERILRELSFIMDARFIPKAVPGNSDSIDLILLTQDKFPFGIQADLINPGIVSIDLSHHNVLGMGHHLDLTTYADPAHKPLLGYRISYTSPNIRRSFIVGKVDYIRRWNQETYQLSFSRDFKALVIRTAGGVSFERTSITRNVDMLDTVFKETSVKYTNTDLWAGRILFPFNLRSRSIRSGVYLSARMNTYQNIIPPDIESKYLYPFIDRTTLLFSAGLTGQGFKKDRLIYTFGRPEDVPFGFLFDITTGITWTNNTSMPYFSLGAAYGTYLKDNSYLYGQVRAGTYLNNGISEQGVFKFAVRYFTKLHEYHRYKYRNFINFNYVTGINRYPGEFISISDEYGIQGLINTSLRGNDKIVLNLESVIFTPYVLFGFHFGIFGGLDLGYLKREYERFSDSRLFSGLNFGLRIKNEQLIFDTFVIRFSFYPGKPSGGTARYFVIDYEPGLKLNDFLPDKPDIVPYR